MTAPTPAEIYRHAAELFEGGRFEQAAAALHPLIAAPRRGPPAYEQVLDLHLAALRGCGAFEEALDVLADALPRLPACSAEFDARYMAALRHAAVYPAPVGRRARLFALLRVLLKTAAAGDIAECGVGTGLSSYMMCTSLRGADPAFDGAGYHALDSFQGLSEPGPEDAIPAGHPRATRLRLNSRAGAFATPLAQVQRVLADFPRIAFRAGWIPDSLAALPERRYRFVHLDVDLYQPTRGALEYFYARLAPGGRIVCDDYGWPGARRAIDEFCAARGVARAVNALDQAMLEKPAI